MVASVIPVIWLCTIIWWNLLPAEQRRLQKATAFVPMHRSNHQRQLQKRRHLTFGQRWLGGETIAETQNYRLVERDDSSSPDDTYQGVFDGALWEEYETTLNAVVQTARVMRNEVDQEVAPVIEFLLTNAVIVPIEVSPTEFVGGGGTYQDQVKTQRQLFLNQTGLTWKQYEFAVKTLTYLGDYSAKRRLFNSVRVAWHKLLESGMIPRENCISTYLYVAGLRDDGTDDDLTGQIAAFHDLLYEPNEKTITLRVKSMVAQQDARGAMELLNSLPGNEKNERWKRLRTFSPILELYCSRGDMASALSLYQEMQEEPGVVFEPDTYALLIGTLAERGCFRRDSEPIQGATGFPVTHGPALFDQLCSEMGDDVLDLNEESVKMMYNGFVKGFQKEAFCPFEELSPCNDPAREELVLDHVSVNEENALCPRTGVKLRLLRLEEKQRRQVHDTLLAMAGTEYEEYTVKLQNRRKNKAENQEKDDKGRDFAVAEITKFSQWLNDREGEPFTAIVDGPNIAYYGRGKFDYRLIDLVVETLEEMGERPLVVIGEKYVASGFYTSKRKAQVLTDEAVSIRDRLIDEGKMYVVAKKCLDDYYWMLGSVSDQTTSRNGTRIHVSATESNGRYPGLRPMLITNDKMRDHRLQLLEQRLFRRWTSCHIVNYNVTLFENDDETIKDVEFFAADHFSREIQGNPAPANANATVWHFPVADWDEHDRFCIRIP